MQVKCIARGSSELAFLLAISCLGLLSSQGECLELPSRYKRSDAAVEAATTTTPKQPASSQQTAAAFEAECLRQHNKWRKLHRARPLKIDPKLVKFAQQRAEHIAASDGSEFKHPDELEWGENLAWHSDPATSCAKLIKMWYDEVKLYSYKKAAFSHEAGHFTQLVWRDSKKVGCARAFSSGTRGGVYLVCNYDPAGNWKGEFKENVKTAKKSSRNKKKNKNKNKNKDKKQQQQDNATDPTTTTTTTTTSTTKKPANLRS